MSQTAERMSRVDTAWLRMDNDVNLMMIVGVWLLQPGITHAALSQRIEDKLLKYGRFRQKVVQDAMGASWVDDEHFDIARHVVHEALEPRSGQSMRDALQERAGELATTPFDPRHPLWQFHLIEHYDGGSAMIARVHHCIGDGIALISVVMSITDGGMDPPQRKKREQPDEAHEEDWLSDAVLKPLTDITIKAIGMYGSGVAKSMEMLSHPQQPLLGSLDVARVTARQAVAILAREGWVNVSRGRGTLVQDRAAAGVGLAALDTAVVARYPAGLSAREVEVLGHVAAGRTNREIGKRLGVAERTARTHVYHVLQKLDARNRAMAVRKALEHELV